MDAELLFIMESSSDESDENTQRIVRRRLRDDSNPLSLPTKAFIKRFRLSKEAFDYVLKSLEFKSRSSTAVSPVLQLSAALLLLGGGGFHHSVGCDYLIGMCQSLVSRHTNSLLKQIEEKLCPKHTKFMPQSPTSCKEWFYEKYKIPRVIGCIDGTHIGLQKPSQNEHMFFSRKEFHSLNVMIISDHQYRICALNAKYGGAAHDSFIWRHSHQRRVLEELFESNSNSNSWLLGDSGYPLEPWRITPYRNPQDGSDESAFNEVHSKARCIVERTIGILKGRWKILGYDKRGRYTPEKMTRFVNACSALHNICMLFKVPFNQPISRVPDTNDINVGEDTRISRVAQNIRNQIKQSILS